MSSRRTTALAAAASALMVLAGVVTFVSSPPASFGWFAYSPLSDEDFSTVLSGAVLLSHTQASAVVLTAAGLILAAALVGYRLGQRARRPW